MDGADWKAQYHTTDTGVIFTHTAITMADITDGMSNTFLVGEKYVNPDVYFTGVGHYDDSSWEAGQTGTFALDRHYQQPNGHDFVPRQDTPGVDTGGCFGSAHASGFNMAMCDGSVHCIDYSIDQQAIGVWAIARMDCRSMRRNCSLHLRLFPWKRGCGRIVRGCGRKSPRPRRSPLAAHLALAIPLLERRKCHECLPVRRCRLPYCRLPLLPVRFGRANPALVADRRARQQDGGVRLGAGATMRSSATIRCLSSAFPRRSGIGPTCSRARPTLGQGLAASHVHDLLRAEAEADGSVPLADRPGRHAKPDAAGTADRRERAARSDQKTPPGGGDASINGDLSHARRHRFAVKR